MIRFELTSRSFRTTASVKRTINMDLHRKKKGSIRTLHVEQVDSAVSKDLVDSKVVLLEILEIFSNHSLVVHSVEEVEVEVLLQVGVGIDLYEETTLKSTSLYLSSKRVKESLEKLQYHQWLIVNRVLVLV